MRKLLCCILIPVLCLALACPVPAAETQKAVAPPLIDDADLLSVSEEAALLETLETISRQHQVQIAVVTVQSTGGYSADAYINYVYDSYAYGFGPNRDGVLLVVDMGSRTLRILSNGLAADAITMSVIEELTEQLTPYLSEGDYAGAFDRFADRCAYYINGHINGFPLPVGRNLLISLVVGLVIALIVTGVMRGQLKSVSRKPAAADYMKKGSMKLTLTHDIFLYRNVTRQAKPKSTSGSGSSSGGSRNVGGGRF